MVGLHGERRKTEREKSFCLYVSHHRPTTEREEIFFLIIIIIIFRRGVFTNLNKITV
jgi:hypothetical protein